MKLFESKKPISLWVTSFLLILALVTTSTLAWFSMNTVVQLTSPSDQNLAVQVNSGDLEIAVSYQLSTVDNYGEFTEYSEYGRDLLLSVTNPQFIDVTGDGASLWFPTYLNEHDVPEYTDGDSWADKTSDPSFCVTLNLKFRTSRSMDVYLDNQSYVSEIENILGDNIVRSSAFGAFSCDGIAGATRVAFLEKTVEGSSAVETLKAIWIPNDKYCLTYDDGVASFTLNGQREDPYTYWTKIGSNNNSYMQQTVISKTQGTLNYSNGKIIVGTNALAVFGESTVNYGAPLLEFIQNGEMQEKELVIRIWFEGTDREADTALDGGVIKYRFSFTGINKESLTNEEEARVSDISFIGRDFVWGDHTSCAPVDGLTQILYSYDCIDWTPYGGFIESHPIRTGTVYIRTAETSAKKSSSVYAVTVAYDDKK